MPPSRSCPSSLHSSSLTNARKTRRFLFDAREPFGKKLEFVARNGGEILFGGRGKGEERAEKRSARRERNVYLNAQLFAEWTLSVLPTIVLDLEGEKKMKQKALGKAFGSLEEEEGRRFADEGERGEIMEDVTERVVNLSGENGATV